MPGPSRLPTASEATSPTRLLVGARIGERKEAQGHSGSVELVVIYDKGHVRTGGQPEGERGDHNVEQQRPKGDEPAQQKDERRQRERQKPGEKGSEHACDDRDEPAASRQDGASRQTEDERKKPRGQSERGDERAPGERCGRPREHPEQVTEKRRHRRHDQGAPDELDGKQLLRAHNAREPGDIGRGQAQRGLPQGGHGPAHEGDRRRDREQQHPESARERAHRVPRALDEVDHLRPGECEDHGKDGDEVELVGALEKAAVLVDVGAGGKEQEARAAAEVAEAQARQEAEVAGHLRAPDAARRH